MVERFRRSTPGRRTGDLFASIREGYSAGRILLLLVILNLVAIGLLQFGAPGWFWWLAGVVSGVLIEDSTRSLRRRVGLALRRSQTASRVGERAIFAGRQWPALVIDHPPGGIRFSDVDIHIEEGDLEVPEMLSAVAAHLETILHQHPLPHGVVFDNNPCLIATSQPRRNRPEVDGREVPRVQFTAQRSTYYIKAIARGSLPGIVLDHVRPYWDPTLPDLEDVRRLLLSGRSEHEFYPLRHPNLGLAIAPIIDDAGKLYTAWQQRSYQTAVNPGRLAVPVNEGLSPADQDDHTHRVDLRKAFLRAIREEIGQSPQDPETGIVGVVLDVDGSGYIDRNGLQGGGGIVVVGWARFAISPDDYVALQARDLFETGSVSTVELGVTALSQVLSRFPAESWFAPGVLAMAAGLERYRPGGRLLLDRAMRRTWGVGGS